MNSASLMAVDGIVDVVHCRHSLVLGGHFLHGGWRDSFREGQDHVSKYLEADGAAGVISRRLRIPRMHNDLVGELIAPCTVRVADLENGIAGPIGTLLSP